MSQLDSINYDEKMTIKLLERERERLHNGGMTAGEGTLLLERRVPLRIENGPESHGLREAYFDEELGKLVASDEWSMKPLEDGAVLLSGQRAEGLIAGGKVATDKERLSKNNLSLMDAKSAKTNTKKIDKQVNDLLKLRDELNNTPIPAKNLALGAATANAQLEGHAVMTSLGVMQPRQTDYQENPLAGKNLDAADVRLTSSNDAVGRMYQQLDSLFKDRIHKSLGLGGMWDNVQNITQA
jgi:hypothetical protein